MGMDYFKYGPLTRKVALYTMKERVHYNLMAAVGWPFVLPFMVGTEGAALIVMGTEVVAEGVVKLIEKWN
jgi:hypothetical protein